MTKDREKAIKLYWNIAKERCPFHEEEMVNSFLEGFIDCAEYLLLQNAELEKEFDYQKQARSIAENAVVDLTRENAELKERVDNLYNSDCWASEHLTKAKDIMKRLVDLSNSSRSLLGGTWHETVREAEDFLKENSTYERIQKAKYNYTD